MSRTVGQGSTGLEGSADRSGPDADDTPRGTFPDLPQLPPKPPLAKFRPLSPGRLHASWVPASRRPRNRPWSEVRARPTTR